MFSCFQQSYADEKSKAVSSGNKQEVAPVQPGIPNEKNDVIKEENHSVEPSISKYESFESV